MNTTTIHPNDLFAPFTPDPDGQSWALTTDADGNILPASHDGPGVAIWCIRIIGERTYAITRQVWDCPSKTVYRGRIWARWFFRLLMLNFESPPKIEWEQKSPKAQKKRRSGKNHKGRPVDTAAIVALLPPEGASRPQWVALGKAAGFSQACVYDHITKAFRRGLVAQWEPGRRFIRVAVSGDVSSYKSETP